MNDKQELFGNYLSNHLSHVADPGRSRNRRKVIMAHNYQRLLPHDRSAHILEIGPGYGELLELLVKDFGYEQVRAIDLSSEVVDFCNTIVPGSTSWVEDTSVFLADHIGCYDCIFMLHVLEHIPKSEIIPLLKIIREALAPHGKLIIEVPNMANPVTGPYTFYADFTHEVGFHALSLSYVLHMANFSWVETSEVKLPLDRFTRILQLAVQIPMKLILRLIYEAYRIPGATILSASLYSLAIK